MNLVKIFLYWAFIEEAAKWFVEGLQCYVCEDCSEHKDFEELHICGEISIKTTIKPVTLTVVTDNSNALYETTMKSTFTSTTNPSTNNYLHVDNEETHHGMNSENSDQEKTTTATTRRNTTSTTPATPRPTSSKEKPLVENPTTVTEKLATKPWDANSKITTKTATATTTLRPVDPIDYDDYLEYEDTIKTDTRIGKSFLNVNETVCYMITYRANNKIFTNRGCTTYISASKYLTCQSLHNGSPMESCRVCSSNGCNKFLHDDGNEDSNGTVTNSADILDHLGVLMIFLWVSLNRLIT